MAFALDRIFARHSYRAKRCIHGGKALNYVPQADFSLSRHGVRLDCEEFGEEELAEEFVDSNQAPATKISFQELP